MGYNTRRKSLSLPSLGIALPGVSRSARSPPATVDGQSPPSKRVKRTHSGSSSSSVEPTPTPTPANLTRPLALRFDERPKSSGRAAAHTPPPSPGGMAEQTKVDTQGIDDSIVVAVIEQLEKTGNRPHLLKELAAVLSATIPIVESSANPAAIISSRLATYLKRTWTALSKCPLDKKLVGTHPKRIYYFLTTTPHQPIPANVESSLGAARIISPSLSSNTSDAEDLESRSRDRMSPSPELDLSTPEYDDGTDPFSNQAHPPTTANISHNRRAQSPPLEKEEREFTQTATFLQRRKSQEAEAKREASIPTEEKHTVDVTMSDIIESQDETEECAARKNSEAAAVLFGHMDHRVSALDFAPSSPIMKATLSIEMPPPTFQGSDKHEHRDDWCWSELKSPENVELHELDDLFGEY